MPAGNVKWFDTKKGYGFIIGEGGQDVFVHYTSIMGDGFRSLKDGELVEYELLESAKGFQARNVRRTDGHGDSAAAPPPASTAQSMTPCQNCRRQPMERKAFIR